MVMSSFMTRNTTSTTATATRLALLCGEPRWLVESYCLCLDNNNASAASTAKGALATTTTPVVATDDNNTNELLQKDKANACSDSDDSCNDDDNEDIAQIRIQEFQEFLIRKEQRRRELEREVLPRVIAHPRCVQYLNASGSHAVSMMTPAFSCGPIAEPVTILCVAIATEDGCFLSGLEHRFEFGHLYPETSVLETTERSSICIAMDYVVGSQKRTDDRQTFDDNQSNGNKDIEDSTSSSRNTRISEVPQHQCSCLFQGVGEKLANVLGDDDDTLRPARIHRGRFGPGAWHCYTAVFDGSESEIRVDGVPEPMTTHANSKKNMVLSQATAVLDGLTLGSDHCFGISLCCGGQEPGKGQGEGAIAQVAVFQGRLPVADLECLEQVMMRQHGLAATAVSSSGAGSSLTQSTSLSSSPQADNEMERHAEALFVENSCNSINSTDRMMVADDRTRGERSSKPRGVPLRYLTRHRSVAWSQVHPVTDTPIFTSRIGARNSTGSSSDW
jgi:hypothetical protein